MQLNKEDAMWKQRSCLNWFQEVDHNTRFFHAKALSCFKKNLIDGVLDSNEVWQESNVEIERVFVECYIELFTSSRPTYFLQIVDVVQPRLLGP